MAVRTRQSHQHDCHLGRLLEHIGCQLNKCVFILENGKYLPRNGHELLVRDDGVDRDERDDEQHVDLHECTHYLQHVQRCDLRFVEPQVLVGLDGNKSVVDQSHIVAVLLTVVARFLVHLIGVET